MKFIHNKDGRQLFVRGKDELVCGRCKRTEIKQWYYYKPFNNIFCYECARFPGFGLFDIKKAVQEPFEFVDDINFQKKDDHLIIN